MTLRDRFEIVGNDKELIGNVSSNIGRVLRDIGKVLGILANISMKEICQGVVI
jgi:hypothetical protein